MLREFSKPIRRIQQVLDVSAVGVTWFIAYFVRFNYLPNATGENPRLFGTLGLILMAISFYIYTRSDLYAAQRYQSWYREFIAIIVANIQAVLIFVALLYMVAPERVSRLTIGIYAVAIEVVHVLIRIVTRRRLYRLRASGRNLRHALLIGDGPQMDEYATKILSQPTSGLRFVGWVDGGALAEKHGVPPVDEGLLAAADRLSPDLIVIGYLGNNPRKLEPILRDAYNQMRPVVLLPQLAHVYLRNRIDDYEGIPIIQLNRPRISSIDLFFKRLLDIGGAFVGIVLLSPLLIVIALLVKVTSRGPIFYGQERITVDGRSFKMWKFRSMRVDAEQTAGAQWAVKNDPRRTPIGRFLRASSIDELPQLWNILLGDMSIVGPRPERPVFVEKFRDEIPGYMLRHTMKAGLTGWAQANGWRGNTSLHKRVEYDIYYIKNWSLALDLEIVLLTLIRGFVDKNAY